jgi:hypothetical protein
VKTSTHMMTTEAAVRLMPIPVTKCCWNQVGRTVKNRQLPPAFVDNKKTEIDSSSVNSSTSVCRTSTGVLPVRTRNLMLLSRRTTCKISKIWVNLLDVRFSAIVVTRMLLTWEKIKTLRCSLQYLVSNRKRTWTFPASA